MKLRAAAIGLVALFGVCALGAGEALAARTLVAHLLARQPASAGEPAMSALALEACLRLAGQLDRTGRTIADQGAAIERLAAERLSLKNQINAELDQLSHYDAKAMEAFQRRVAHNDEVERKLKVGGPAHLKDRQAYDEAVAGFKKNCSGAFTAADLIAVKAKLGLQ